jgi:hypothetical protein
MFTGAVQSSLHRGNRGSQGFGDFAVAAAFLDQGEQCAILGAELIQRMAKGVEFLGIHRAIRLRNILMLRGEGQKDTAKFLAAKMIDASIAGQAEKPGFKLGRSLQAVECANHFDENLLSYVFDGIAAAGDGVDKPGDPPLVADDKVALGRLVADLSPADEFNQGAR